MQKQFTEGTVATCPFCGQTHIITHNALYEMDEQSELSPEQELGARECNCTDAMRWTQRKKNKDKLPGIIKEFKRYCEDRGVDVGEGIQSVIKNAASVVIDENASKVSINIRAITLTMKLGKDAVLTFSVKYKEGYDQLTT